MGNAEVHIQRGATLTHHGFRAFAGLEDVVPRLGYKPTGEDRAWGRRLAKRYGNDGHFDDREFKVAVKGRKPPCLAILDTSPVKATGGAKIASLIGTFTAPFASPSTSPSALPYNALPSK